MLAIDPDERMADFAGKSGLEVEVAPFESWDSAGRQFDAVVAGQAWHWVDPVAGAAKAAQVLVPAGGWPCSGTRSSLRPTWRTPSLLSTSGCCPNHRFLRGTNPGLKSYSTFFTKAADGIAQAGLFGDSERWRFNWEHSYTRREWLEQVPTFGGHSQFPPAQLGELLTGIGEAIDAVGGSFTMRYIAVVVTADRTHLL